MRKQQSLFLIVFVFGCICQFVFDVYRFPFKTTTYRHMNYQLLYIHDVFNSDECDLIQSSALPNLVRSIVMSDDSKQRVNIARNSTGTFLSTNKHLNTPVGPLLDRIDRLASRLSGKPVENMEETQVVRYEPGQFYRRHWDALNPFDPKVKQVYEKEEATLGGLRYATLLVYLNDVPLEYGGETEFPRLNIKIHPKQGSAIFFKNLHPTQYKPHPMAIHASLPLHKDIKWVCNKWIRSRKF